MSVTVTTDGAVRVVTLDRPDVRNAVDGEHATALYDAFRAFDADDTASVAVLHGADGVFCAGADLDAVSRGEMPLPGPPGQDDRGPMGPTRLLLSKPVIAAVDGYAVAGGIELALWCDLRVADPAATFGVFCRRWGVPLVDGGTVRLPRLVGFGVAMDLILTGRAVGADEALRIGLVNRVSAPGQALAEAVRLAHDLAALPQLCLRHDRLSAYEQEGLDLDRAMVTEWAHGLVSLREAAAGAARFAAGEGRHGTTA
ncbi:MAG: crotonase/enoyl-CoA hydratase family protein [Frankiaceae bacterium]|nr:crotonase/enoyl-CoA hydratase family protein [Frankiaceae bacterium]